MSTITSRDLLSEATYPLLMDKLVDHKDPLTANLFVERTVAKKPLPIGPKREIGPIHSLKNGYGFIAKEPNNVFFHWSELENGDFNDLRVGDKLEYQLVRKDNGQEVATKIICV
jgi:cold shock CspA family protein